MRPKPEYLLFDLDGTLYSARWGLEQDVSRRVDGYVASFLKLSREQAHTLRKERIARGIGTTLEWLIAEHQLDTQAVEGYFASIHPENEADVLPPDPDLKAFLASIRLPMAVMTNSCREHAVRILTKLGVGECFASIFDIRFNGYRGKPHPQAFGRTLAAAGVEAGRCILVDDVRLYIEGYRKLGGIGVYYDEDDKHPEFPGPRITKLTGITEYIG